MLATIQTDFVTLIASATSDNPEELQQSLSTRLVAPHRMLPSGLSVDSTLGLVVSLRSGMPTRDFLFALRIDAISTNGSPESGECLDAQSWDLDGGIMMLGTEDGESLQSRMDWSSFSIESGCPLSYLSDGFELSVNYIPPHVELDFHFVLAYSRVNLGDDATWFAVDVPHATMLGFPSTGLLRFR